MLFCYLERWKGRFAEVVVKLIRTIVWYSAISRTPTLLYILLTPKEAPN